MRPRPQTLALATLTAVGALAGLRAVRRAVREGPHASRPGGGGSGRGEVARQRADLARRLHDGPLQGLHALRISLGPDPDPALARGLLDASRDIRRITEELRSGPAT